MATSSDPHETSTLVILPRPAADEQRPVEPEDDHDTLSMLPSIPSFINSKRSLEDEGIGNSSDTPMFSSDDLSASAENYVGHREKRIRRAPWFDLPTKEAQVAPIPRQKRAFTRNIDSGVFMGCDSDFEEEPDGLEDDEKILPEELRDLALRTTDDPQIFTGPVYPYWDDQPVDTKAFWRIQQAAHKEVNRCVDAGAEAVDLSDFGLAKIQESTLEPLQFLLAERRVLQPNTEWEEFESFVPDLELYLANNGLSTLPGRIFQLQNITVLSLRGNNLSELPAAIGNLVNLKELNAGNNNLRWLPYELIKLMRRMPKCPSLFPNPFFRPMPKPIMSKCTVHTSEITFFDVDGTLMRDSPPAASATSSHWPPQASDWTSGKSPDKIPSLFELALQTCQQSAQLSQLPFMIPGGESSPIYQALKQAWKVKQHGEQHCSICNDRYIIPRTEWIQWENLSGLYSSERFVKTQRHNRYNGRKSRPSRQESFESPLPFLRRGCSWRCVPEQRGRKIVPGWSQAKGMDPANT